MPEFSRSASQEDFDFVISKSHDEIGMAITVEIVRREGHGSAMHGIVRPFLELAVAMAQKNGNLVCTGTRKDQVRLIIVIQIGHREGTGFFADIQLNLIFKGAVAVAQQN